MSTDKKSHQWYMKQALKEAKKAYLIGEAPIGAIIVRAGEIVARAHNERELKQDATKHAEITAIKKACAKLGTWRLNDCDMYVTLEPCAMCAGALVQCRMGRLFMGASDPKAGAVGSVINILTVKSFNHHVELYEGIMEDECSQLLKDFFSELRIRGSRR